MKTKLRDRTSRHVALKVVKSDGHYTETARDEILLLQRVVTSSERHAGRHHVVGLVDNFIHDGVNGSHVCMVFEVLGENLLGLIKRYQHRGVPQHIVKQIAKQVLLGLDYLHTECKVIHTDLKPENVLICIEDVESVVQAELATCPAAVPTKLVGVPPSQGRLGNQTPRKDSILMSQPLASPSSSYGTSPMLDKYGFGMSKISGAGSVVKNQGLGAGQGLPSRTALKGSADSIGEGVGKVKLDSSLTWEKTKIAPQAPGTTNTSGISLLSKQMAYNPNANHSSPSLQPTSEPSSTAVTPSHTVIATPATSDNGTGDELRISTSVMSTDSTSPPTNGHQHSKQHSTISSDAAVSPSSTHMNNLQDQEAHLNPHPYHTEGDEGGVAPIAGDPNTLPPPFPYDPESLEKITVKIADLGNACWVDHHFTNDIQTRQYRCPEIILGTKWNQSVDIWSAACLVCCSY